MCLSFFWKILKSRGFVSRGCQTQEVQEGELLISGNRNFKNHECLGWFIYKGLAAALRRVALSINLSVKQTVQGWQWSDRLLIYFLWSLTLVSLLACEVDVLSSLAFFLASTCFLRKVNICARNSNIRTTSKFCQFPVHRYHVRASSPHNYAL